MYEGFLNDFQGGLDIEQFTNLFPDLNNGLATANLVFRVLDEDNSKKLGFKEFLQAIDLVGARLVEQILILTSRRRFLEHLMISCDGLSKCMTRTTPGRLTLRRWRESCW